MQTLVVRHCGYHGRRATARAMRLVFMRSHTTALSSAVEKRVQELMGRYQQVLEEMSASTQPTTSTSSSDHQALGKELSRLSKIASLIQKRQALQEEQDSILELRKDAQEIKDDELQNECQSELQRIQSQRAKLERTIVDAVLPQDTTDGEDDTAVVVEVRSGTGGDEASLFAMELLEAYQKTAMAFDWKIETLHVSKTEIGGVREAAVAVSGSPSFRLPLVDDNGERLEQDIGYDDDDDQPLLGPYGVFQFESGVHRVQRVPVNDSRIHTSACSVAVLPSTNSQQVEGLLPMSELKIETMRSSGAGGQHVNTTDSAVRITHIPTGIVASIQDERSQRQNKEKALKLVSARVRDRIREEEERERGETRSNLMGGGDRSERIRTYNYPQDRVTDHRSKVSKFGITSLLSGDAENGLVVSFLPELKQLRREELLQKLEQES